MEYLKHYRSARGYSQQQMADLLNVSRVTYARYEQGAREPDIDTMIKLSSILHVLIDQLVGVIQPDETYSSNLYDQIHSEKPGALEESVPNAFVGMYGNGNYFLLTKDGQDKVNAYIDDLYGNPQYADDAGRIVLRDPKTGEAIMQTIAAEQEEDNDRQQRVDAVGSYLTEADKDTPNDKKA